MGRVRVASQWWGYFPDRTGTAQPGLTATLTGTVYEAATGTTAVSGLVTDDNGELPGYVEEGTYTLGWTDSDGAHSLQVEAVSGQPGGQVNLKSYGAIGDGVTDDQDTVQAAVTGGTGGVVYVPPGRFVIEGIVIPSNTVVCGPGTFVVSPTTGLYPLYIAPGGHDITLRDFAVDGNQANIAGDETGDGNPAVAIQVGAMTEAACERIFCDRLHLYDQKRQGIVFQRVEGGAVTGCTLEDGGRDGITLYGSCKNVRVTDNTVTGCGDDYIAVNSEVDGSTGHLAEGIVVANNTLSGPGWENRGFGIYVRGGKDIVIAGNAIRDTSIAAIMLTDIETTALSDVVVVGNTIYNPGNGGGVDSKMGIGIESNQAGLHTGTQYATIKRVLVANNTIRRTGGGSTGDTAYTSIRLSNAQTSNPGGDILIANNSIEDSGYNGIAVGSAGWENVTIHGNRIKGSANRGIQALFAAKRVHVVANTVYNNAADGIRVENVIDGSCVGNRVYDDRGGSATQTNGIYLDALSGNWQFSGNHAWGNVTANMPVAGAASVLMPSVASAATITVPSPSEVFHVTGTTTITSVTASWAGRRVTLVFADALTLTDGSNLKLAGNLVTTADDTITLVCDGANWIETGRSVN